jgi:hypothetical protein
MAREGGGEPVASLTTASSAATDMRWQSVSTSLSGLSSLGAPRESTHSRAGPPARSSMGVSAASSRTALCSSCGELQKEWRCVECTHQLAVCTVVESEQRPVVDR